MHTVIGGAVLVTVLAVHTLMGWQAEEQGETEPGEKGAKGEGRGDEEEEEIEDGGPGPAGEGSSELADVKLTTTNGAP